MSYSPIPLWAIQDSDGVPLVGAKVKFYVGGTSTPQAVYSDRARSISLGTQLTVDASGNIQMFYMLETTTYKAVITDSDDNVLYTFDDIVSPGSTGTGVQRTARATCPLDYGAIGDGVADEQSYVQSAIDDATGDVDLAGMVYRCDTAIVLKDGVRLFNGTLNFSLASAATSLVDCSGEIGTGASLFNDALQGDRTVVLNSGHGLVIEPNDLFFVYSTDTWASSQDAGEIIRVMDYDSGTNTITMAGKILGECKQAAGASVRKFDKPIRNVRLEDLRIIGATQVVQQYGVDIQYADNVRVKNVECRGVSGFHIAVRRSHDVVVDGATCITDDPGTIPSPHVGILVEDGSLEVEVNNCRVSGFKYGMRIGRGAYPDRMVSINNCHVTHNELVGIELFRGTEFCSVNKCTIRGSAAASDAGVHVYGVNCSINDNEIFLHTTGIKVWNETLQAYAGSPRAVSQSITGNRVVKGAIGIDAETRPSAISTDILIINGNKIDKTSSHGIRVRGIGASLGEVSITDNSVLDPVAEGIFVDSGNETIDLLSITGNTVDGPTADSSIRVTQGQADNIGQTLISGNAVSTASTGIEFTNGGNITVSSNTIDDMTSDGIKIQSTLISISASSNFTVSDNTIRSVSRGILIAGGAFHTFDNVSVSGGVVSTCVGTSGIYIGPGNLGDMESVTVSGVVVENCADYGIYLPGTAARRINNASITGCSVKNVDCGIRVDNSDGLIINGNTIRDCNATILGSGIFIRDSKDVVVDGNQIRDVEQSCIYYDVTSAQENVAISNNNLRTDNALAGPALEISMDANLNGLCVMGNSIYKPQGDGIYLDVGAVSACDLIDSTIKGNFIVRDNAASSVKVQTTVSGSGVTGLMIDSNNLRSVSNTGYNLFANFLTGTSAAEMSIKNNDFSFGGSISVSINAVSTGFVSGLRVQGNTWHNLDPLFNALVMTGTGNFNDISITGNIFQGGADTVEFNPLGTAVYDDIAIIGNVFNSLTTKTAIYVNPAATAAVNRLQITSNQFTDGSNVIYIGVDGNHEELIISSNVFMGAGGNKSIFLESLAATGTYRYISIINNYSDGSSVIVHNQAVTKPGAGATPRFWVAGNQFVKGVAATVFSVTGGGAAFDYAATSINGAGTDTLPNFTDT